jgi:acid phosphatase
MRRALLAALALTLALLAGCAGPEGPAPEDPTAKAVPSPATKLPRPDHVLIVVEENRGYDQIIGKADTPYINQLAGAGALFTDAHGIAHPSQPNYLALFSGHTQGIGDDSCPHTWDAPNLGQALIAKGFTFVGYSETMPKAGFTGCESGAYRRKHNPWVNFTNLPAEVNQPLTSLPADWAKLPTVSFVVPDQNHDMHDGTAARADQWLKEHLDGYVQWAGTHNSLLILTFDEDNDTHANRIATIFVGPMVKAGAYGERIDHYSVLRTLEEMYGLAPMGHSAEAGAITSIWR